MPKLGDSGRGLLATIQEASNEEELQEVASLIQKGVECRDLVGTEHRYLMEKFWEKMNSFSSSIP